jgi:5-methylcytosine-specific restriction protein A
MVHLYDLVIARGSTDSVETAKSFGDEEAGTLDETRRYVRHMRIERSSKAADRAKQVHGYVCQTCDVNCAAVYGERGNAFIEAHHLIPLSSLPEGRPVPMDPRRDFAVLCSNCHRMIHRRRPWLEIGELTVLLQEARGRS